MSMTFTPDEVRRGRRAAWIGYALLLAMACGLVIWALATGCSLPANPRTEIIYGPFRLHNSKDVTVRIAHAKVDPATGLVEVEDLEFLDTASIVRLADAEQIRAYTEQVRAVTGMLQQVTATLASMMPGAAAPPVPDPQNP